MPKERDILKIIWQNFVKSLRPKTPQGIYMGTDKFGNKYFEIPKTPGIRGSKDRRYFDPKIKDNYNQELPAEWEAWLRGRRDNPPSIKELLQNQAIADMKKINAAELEKEYRAQKPQELQLQEATDSSDPATQKRDFPKYEEYEIQPGVNQDKDQKEK